MIKLIKKKLAERQLKVVFKKRMIKSRTFFNVLEREQSVIAIIFPVGKKKVHEANNCLVHFFNNYPDTEFILIKPSELKKEELQFCGLPSISYLDQYKSKKINVLIDLNSEVNEIGLFIAAKLRASLKIRLNSLDYGEELFHLSVKSKQESLKDRLKCLKEYRLKLRDVV